MKPNNSKNYLEKVILVNSKKKDRKRTTRYENCYKVYEIKTHGTHVGIIKQLTGESPKQIMCICQ